MDFVDKLFWQCVYFIEFLGNTSGLGYELTNLLLFVVIQPLIILILIWRISRIISIFVLTLEFYFFYILYQNQFYLSFFKDIYDFFNNLIITNIFISLVLPIFLIFLNFLIFGKFSLWLKRP